MVDPLACSPVTGARQRLRAHLKKHDKNRDNLLTKTELKEALKELGIGWPVRQWRGWRCFKEADINRNGLISDDELDDLVDYLNSKGYKIP